MKYRYPSGAATSVVADLQNQTLSALRRHMGPGQRVALLDFPNYENSGDALIFLGELAYLRKLNVGVGYVADHGRYRAEDLRRAVPDGPILLQGGGNFGDRWEKFQLFREQVIEEFPDRHIIQLPQGIEFSEGPRLERAQRVYERHPRITLLMRDYRSASRAFELFPAANVDFCPDMAFGVGLLQRSSVPSVDVVHLKREDSESVSNTPGLRLLPEITVVQVDWRLRGRRKLLASLLRIPIAVAKRVPALRSPLLRVLMACYGRLAELNVDQAVAILSRGKTVVTDRLHAAVLASFLGIPVAASANANGKIEAIFNDYLGRMPGTFFLPSVTQAAACAQSLLVEAGAAAESNAEGLNL